jgi:hypothetical protein
MVTSDDGFIVPKNIAEFEPRFPNYVQVWTWQKIKCSRMYLIEVDDFVADLSLHLRFLPEDSTARQRGLNDIIECFDPLKMFGANQRRFLAYVKPSWVPWNRWKATLQSANAATGAGVPATAGRSAQRSLDLSNARYKGGVTSYLQVITAQNAACQMKWPPSTFWDEV